MLSQGQVLLLIPRGGGWKTPPPHESRRFMRPTQGGEAPRYGTLETFVSRDDLRQFSPPRSWVTRAPEDAVR